MSGLIGFVFSSEEERNEFLLLNDLHLTASAPGTPSADPDHRQTVVDRFGNQVGQTNSADPVRRLDILPEYRPSLRTTDWWHAA